MSPRLEGRPDLASYFNGARSALNVVVYPQGGVTKRAGTRHVTSTKADATAYLIPFQFSTLDSYMLEYGDLYIRVFKDGAPIELAPGLPLEIVTPYAAADLGTLQTRQSADVIYHAHPDYPVYKLSRLSDLEWFWQEVNFRPPALVEEDKAPPYTLVPDELTGLGVTFTTSGPVFLPHSPGSAASDVGKQIVAGVSRAVIVSVQTTTTCTADIIDSFAPSLVLPAAGLNVHFDATQLVLNDTDPVATWPDVSGQGNDALQATPGLQPIYHAAIQNGLPIVRGDGTDDVMTVAPFGSEQPCSMVMVASAAVGVTEAYLVSDNPGPANVAVGRSDAPVAGNWAFYAGLQQTSAVLTDGLFHLLQADFDGVNSVLYYDGVPIASGDVGLRDADGLTLFGAFAPAMGYLAADLGEFAHYDHVLTTPERQSIQGFLQNKWQTPDIGIAAGDWRLVGSPYAKLDVADKAPVGIITTATSGSVDSFRPEDVGKYIVVLGGVIQIVEYVSATAVRGQILAELVDSEKDNPPAGEKGSWTLNIPAWSAERGYPEAIEFHEGRLGFAATRRQPTTWWLSGTDDFENFSPGPLATSAVEYTIASRQVNNIEWMLSDVFLFIGTASNEHTAKGSGIDEPLGGDVIPAVRLAGNAGSASIQSQEVQNGSMFISTSRRRISVLKHSGGGEISAPEDMTLVSEHLFETQLAQTRMAYAKDPDYQVYAVRADGVVLALTYRPQEEVSAWARWVTDGAVESLAVQRHPDGDRDQVWLIVNRLIDGVTKRYIEIIEDTMAGYSTEPSGNQGLMLDCATLFVAPGTATLTGLEYLEAKTVGVKVDGYDVGDKVVSGGEVVLDEIPAATAEIGLRYTMELETMRPAVEGESIEGVPRSWDKVLLRLKDVIGGTINDQAMEYSQWGLYTGDVLQEGIGWSRRGYISIKQEKAYPMTILMFAGELSFGDRMGGDYDAANDT